jgi:hypothetical protein
MIGRDVHSGERRAANLHGRLDETQFRKLVLILLLASGAVLLFG